jgi:UDPglucose--hexose-1-phosphate uridylyltransferase
MVVIAKERAKRPLNLREQCSRDTSGLEHNPDCVFCKANEECTPQEIERIQGNGEWKVRVVPNKYPILSEEVFLENDEEFYKSTAGYGFHEVVIDTVRHNGSFFDMSEEEYIDYFTILIKRYGALKNKNDVKYISIFKNYLAKSGASLEHPHTQILTLPVIPLDITHEMESSRNYFMRNGVYLHDAVIDYEEKKNERIIHNDKNFIIIAPYASTYNYEAEVLYKGIKKLEEINENEIDELSLIMKKLFFKMYGVLGDFPLNIYFHTHIVGETQPEAFKWHIHVAPRLGNFGGFELSTGIYVNSITPENAAGALRW